MSKFEENEIKEQVSLCDANGRLNRAAVGWSRVPLHTCNLSGGHFRKKKWNYWCVTTEDFVFSATVSAIDYADLGFIYFLDCKTKELIEKTVPVIPGTASRMQEPVAADAVFSTRALKVSLLHDGAKMRILVECPRIGGKKLSADITVETPPGHESLSVVVPWSDTRFQYTSKQNTLPASGKVTIGDRTFEFVSGKSFAILDFGRGIWPYKSKWNWGSFSGIQDSDTIGLNIGGKWTDATGSTENGICLNGVLHKVSEDLVWTYDTSDFMSPWTIRSPHSDMLDLQFTPIYAKKSKANMIILKTNDCQCFGHYSGTIRAGGRTVSIKRIFGWAEEHDSLW
jgi:hypothetical protein